MAAYRVEGQGTWSNQTNSASWNRIIKARGLYQHILYPRQSKSEAALNLGTEICRFRYACVLQHERRFEEARSVRIALSQISSLISPVQQLLYRIGLFSDRLHITSLWLINRLRSIIQNLKLLRNP